MVIRVFLQVFFLLLNMGTKFTHTYVPQSAAVDDAKDNATRQQVVEPCEPGELQKRQQVCLVIFALVFLDQVLSFYYYFILWGNWAHLCLLRVPAHTPTRASSCLPLRVAWARHALVCYFGVLLSAVI
jgi:hypothetical protein